GVLIQSSPNNVIGGTVAGAGNLISGNTTNGVTVVLATATGTLIQGNRIGTNAAGTAWIPNMVYGVYAFEGNNMVIGGAAPGAGNLIAGRTTAIQLETTGGHSIQGNLIGTN